jgi:hypothetical protein
MGLIPELWATESLAILEETMGVTNLVHRDFSPMVASHADVVNTRRPAAFSTKRKPQFDSPVNLWHEYKTTTQEPTLTNWI